MLNTNFQKRFINVSLAQGLGILGNQPSTFYTLSGLRVSVDIDVFTGETFGDASIKVYGMSQQLMNKFTAIGPNMAQIKNGNVVQISAGAGSNSQSLPLIYTGVIHEAYADYNSAPNVSFNINANARHIAALTPAKNTSAKGTTPVVNLLNQLASQAGCGFFNLDVPTSASIIDPILFGSYLDQFKTICDFSIPKIYFAMDVTTFPATLRIKQWDSAFNATVSASHIISPDTNMIGYPVYSQNGLTVKSLFIPDVKIGEAVTVKKSIIPSANGSWLVYKIKHTLESAVPDGKWETTLGVHTYGTS